MVETRRLNQLLERLSGSVDFPEGPLVVALSGGADSAALALLASHAGRPVRAVHVDHGTQPSGDLMAAAEKVAAAVGIGITSCRVEVGDQFTEAAARAVRYRALLAERGPGEWILTGHTRDDQAETMLMNLVRGTGLDGLAGIPALVGDTIARPLLDVPRSELRELAVLAGLPFFDDPSNADGSFTRNALRHEVIPGLIGRFNPNLVQALAHTAEVVRNDLAFLDGLVDDAEISIGDGSAAIPVGSLATVPRPVADRLLRRLILAVRPPYGPSHDEMARIWSVARGEAGAAELVGGVGVTVEGALLRAVVVEVPDPGRVELGGGLNRLGRWVLEVVEVPGACRVAPLSPYSAIFPIGTRLTAVASAGVVTVEAGGAPAWIPGRRRLPVAFYNSGDSGYLSILAREDAEWTSSRS